MKPYNLVTVMTVIPMLLPLMSMKLIMYICNSKPQKTSNSFLNFSCIFLDHGVITLQENMYHCVLSLPQISSETGTSLKVIHETPVHHYKDTVTFTFSQGSTADSCNVHVSKIINLSLPVVLYLGPTLIFEFWKVLQLFRDSSTEQTVPTWECFLQA
jgi:hypothetical protein